MINIYDFYNRMQHNNIMLSFKGEISSDLLTSILHITETKLDRMQEEPKIKKKVFNVLVECLQNLYHHIDEVEPVGQPAVSRAPMTDPDISFDRETRAAILMIGKEESSYYILTGNHILNEKVPSLRDRLEKINSLSKEELKALYQEILNNDEFSHKGGGGLGMIDIVRKSGQKLLYHFQSVNGTHSFFSLQIKVSQ